MLKIKRYITISLFSIISIRMKKILTTLVILGSMIGLSHAALIDDAVSWMNSEWLTIFTNTLEYKPNDMIRRDEAAKLFVKFSEIIHTTEYKYTTAECKFSDLTDAHKDLKDIVVESCRLGIFQWSAGKFMPKNAITNEQAVTVLVRILYGKQDEKNVTRRSDNYYKKANEYNLLNNVTLTNKWVWATRGNVGIVLYDASGKNIVWTTDNINSSQNHTTWLIQYTPSQADWSTFSTKPFQKNSNISHDPDGVAWLSPESWEAAKWDGTIYNPSTMSKGDFVKALCPSGDQVRGIREVFYEHQPFADNKNPTKAEIDEWHRIAINHIRELVGYSSEDRQVQKDQCLFVRAHWWDERKFTTIWDLDYPGKLGSAFWPCIGSNNSHCWATFIPSIEDQSSYLPENITSCSATQWSEGVFNASKSNIPWSIKWSRSFCSVLWTEGFWGGHVGPWFHREKFGFSFWDYNPKDNNSIAILRAKWSGQLKPNLYTDPSL